MPAVPFFDSHRYSFHASVYIKESPDIIAWFCMKDNKIIVFFPEVFLKFLAKTAKIGVMTRFRENLGKV